MHARVGSPHIEDEHKQKSLSLVSLPALLSQIIFYTFYLSNLLQQAETYGWLYYHPHLLLFAVNRLSLLRRIHRVSNFIVVHGLISSRFHGSKPFVGTSNGLFVIHRFIILKEECLVLKLLAWFSRFG